MTRTVPPVSIGLPVYNGERYLREAFESLLCQSFEDFELLVCDNASNDGTEAICREFARRDSRVIYHRGEVNQGASSNYNLAVELARGRYFRWHADDDLVDTEALARNFEVLETHPEIILSYPRTQIIDEHSRVVRDYDDNLDVPSPMPSERFSRVLLLTTECNAVFGLMRTDILRQTARIGKYIGSDVVLLGELSLYGQFRQVGDCVFYRRDHPGASSSDRSLRRQMEFYCPGVTHPFLLTSWRHQTEYLRAIHRSPLSAAEKTRAMAFVLRRAYAIRHKLGRDVSVAMKCLFRGGLDDEAQ